MQVSPIAVLALCLAITACERTESQSAPHVGSARSARWSDSVFVVSTATSLEASPVSLPRWRLKPDAIQNRGRIISVADGANLQRAIGSARGGDVLEIAAGAAFVGSFHFARAAGDTGWITVRTAGVDNLIPAGSRVTPAATGKLARITAENPRVPAITFDKGAYGFRLVGVEVVAAADAGEGSALIEVGSGDSVMDDQTEPALILFDRLYIHGAESSNFRRCVALNSASTAIVNSWLSDCHGRGFDSQAIGGWNGKGPYLISNNFIEGAGENIMFGGADPRRSGIVPSDIEIVKNHFYKPRAWTGRWTVKNLFELKIGRRILVEGNIFENNWTDGQDGFAIVLKSVNQENSAPWSQTSDVTFRSNIVRNVANGLNAAGHPESNPAVSMARVYIANSLFLRVGNGDFPGGRLWQVAEVDSIIFSHNSGFGSTHGLLIYGARMPAFTLTDNLFGTFQKNYDTWNFALASADGKGFGQAALDAHTLTRTFRGNILAGIDTPDFASLQLTGWPDDLRLPEDSPLRHSSSDGQTPGVDFNELESATHGVAAVFPPAH